MFFNSFIRFSKNRYVLTLVGLALCWFIGDIVVSNYGWVMVVLFVFSLFMVWIITEQAERNRIAEEHQKKLLEQAKEYQKRRAQLQTWLAENTVYLYENTMNGFTAVNVPADYDAENLDTRVTSFDPKSKRSTLKLSPRTRVFATPEALESLRARNFYASNHKIAGSKAQLDAMIADSRGKVVLIRKDDMFVPFANDGLYSDGEMIDRLKDGLCSSYRALVEIQAPAELRPAALPYDVLPNDS